MSSEEASVKTTQITEDAIVEVLKRHPGVSQAVVYPAPAPGKENALMAVVTITDYRPPTTGGWDNGVDRVPRDREEFFAAVDWDNRQMMNVVLTFIRGELPVDSIPTFIRIVHDTTETVDGVTGPRDLSLDLQQYKEEGWDLDRMRAKGGWPRVFWRPSALGLPSIGDGYSAFWDRDSERLNLVRKSEADADKQKL